MFGHVFRTVLDILLEIVGSIVGHVWRSLDMICDVFGPDVRYAW